MKAITIALAIVLFAAVGCGAKNGTSLNSGDGVTINPPAPMLNDIVQLTLSNAAMFRSFNWSVTDTDGVPTDKCADLQTAVASCSFDMPGSWHVDVQVADRNGTSSSYTMDFDVLDPSKKPNQAPYIVMKIKDATTGSVFGTVATLRTDESGNSSFPKGVAVQFDFSATRDDKDLAVDLSYEMDLGSGYQPVPMVSTRTFANVATIPAKLRVTDSDGNKTEKLFTLYISCLDGAQPPVSIATNNIAINASGDLNYFTYDASSAVTGGIGPYQVKFDFNGDGVYDTDWVPNSSIKAYTLFANTRSVGIKAWDTTCNYFGTATMSHDFVIAHADGIPGVAQGPQIPGYYFLQADVSGLNGNVQLSANANYIATRKEGAPQSEPSRVLCDYRKLPDPNMLGSTQATLEIDGMNHYDRASGQGIYHGMSLYMVGILDPTGSGVAGNVDTSGAKILKAAYATDGGPDNVNATIYTKVGNCNVSLVVTPLPSGSGTCSDNPQMGYPVRIDGTYSCPLMQSPEGWQIKASNGAFYCEVAKVDACPPGGGGGGGGIPPIPR